MTSAETTTATASSRSVARSTPISIWLQLIRHHLRIQALSGLIWIIGLVLMPILVVGVWEDTFPTEQERIAMARSIEGNPAFEAMFGRAIALHTIEGFTMWRAGGPLFPAIAIWGALAATRLARGDEDKGHDELLLGGVLTRRALLLSAIVSLAVLVLTYSLLSTLLLPAVSTIAMDGSLRFALAMAGGFTFFAGLGILMAQITPNRSSALRLTLGVIGLGFAIRILAVLESTPDWVVWITPFGWFAETGTPTVGSNIPLLLFATGTLLFSSMAVVLAGHREIHGSLLFRIRDEVKATRPYRSLWVHEAGQHLPSFIGFALVGTFISALFGMVANDFVEFIEDFPAFAQFLAEFGLERPDDPAAFVGLIIMMYVLISTLYAAGHVSAMRDAESSGQLAILFTLPITRYRWLGISTIVGLVAIALLSFIIAYSAMIGSAITGSMLDPVDATRAGLNLIPISFFFLGVGILIFALLPSLTGTLIYTGMLTSYMLVLLDGFLDIPDWIVTLSPFDHLALVPGQPMNLTSSAVFLLIGIGSIFIGAIIFRHRDLKMD